MQTFRSDSKPERSRECLISDSGHERPRERLIQHGPHVLTTAELLAIILGTGPRGDNVVNFTTQLLKHFGSLRALLSASPQELTKIRGLGIAKSSQIMALHELAIRSLEEQLRNTNVLNQSHLVKKYCARQLGHHTIEYCHALFLDKSFHLLHTEVVAKGTIDQASVYPREIVKAALKHHASHVILAHNHPSGSLSPSAADIGLTEHLKNALALVDIQLIDHLIVAAGKAVSLAEMGHM